MKTCYQYILKVEMIEPTGYERWGMEWERMNEVQCHARPMAPFHEMRDTKGEERYRSGKGKEEWSLELWAVRCLTNIPV